MGFRGKSEARNLRRFTKRLGLNHLSLGLILLAFGFLVAPAQQRPCQSAYWIDLFCLKPDTINIGAWQFGLTIERGMLSILLLVISAVIFIASIGRRFQVLRKLKELWRMDALGFLATAATLLAFAFYAAPVNRLYLIGPNGIIKSQIGLFESSPSGHSASWEYFQSDRLPIVIPLVVIAALLLLGRIRRR